MLKDMQRAAAAGAAAMRPEARAVLTGAILKSQQASGGFCALDGLPDLYYSFFARHALLALGAEYDHAAFIGWTRGALRNARGVDRVCAELILLQEGKRSRAASMFYLLRTLGGSGGADSYKLFLTAFLMEELLPQRLTRALINRAAAATLRQRAHLDFSALSTPRAAVCALLADRIGDQGMRQRMTELLRQRHQPSGGYASAAGARADLLSTAVVLFVSSLIKEGGQSDSADRALIEMCWQDDGLFSAAPDQESGDLEHTFYALLALGCP